MADDTKHEKLRLDTGSETPGLKDGPKKGGPSASPFAPHQSNAEPSYRPRREVGKAQVRRPKASTQTQARGDRGHGAYVMSDNYTHRRRMIRWGASVTVIVAFALAMLLSPRFAAIVERGALQAYLVVLPYFDDKAKLSARPSDLMTQPKRQALHKKKATVSSTPGAREQFFVSPNCQSIARTNFSTSDYKRMSHAEKIIVSECFLLYGDIPSAEVSLRDFGSILRRSGENAINRDLKPGGLCKALYANLDLALAKADYRESDNLLARQCRKWQRTPTCVAKLTNLVARKYGSAGHSAYNLMSKGSKQDPQTETRYHLAGAQAAALLGQSRTAADRFEKALAASPSDSLWLRKKIYDSYAFALYQQGDFRSLDQLTKRALRDLKQVNGSALVKLRLLSDIADPRKRVLAIKRFLRDRRSQEQGRGDLETIEILGTESIRFRQEVAFLSFLKGAKKIFSQQYRAGKSVSRELKLWEIRAQLSRGAYELVFQALGAYETEFGQDALSSLLRGIAYMGFSPNKQYQLLATKELQRSLRKHHSWEGLYALGLSLVRGGKPKEAGALMQDLSRKTRTPLQRFWFDMLRAEYLMAMNQHQRAIATLKKWRVRQPAFHTPTTLLVKAFQATNQHQLARHSEQTLDYQRSQLIPAQALELQSSPTGPMVLFQQATLMERK